MDSAVYSGRRKALIPTTFEELFAKTLSESLVKLVEKPLLIRPPSIAASLPDDCFISQSILGDLEALSAVRGEDKVLIDFARLYAKMELGNDLSLAYELAADFLNVHNGFFLVTLSMDLDVESRLLPPTFRKDCLPLSAFDSIFSIPVLFKFGQLEFFYSE